MNDGPTRSQRVVRVGVIGRGFGARFVAPAFAAADGCEVVDVISPRDTDVVTALCGRRDIDLISVHAPPFLHVELVQRAIEGGHAVLCDKPFGRSTAEASHLHDLALEAGVVNLVNFEFRRHRARRRLRELVTGGAVGTVERVAWSAFASGWRSPQRRYGWVFDKELGGGWVGAWGSHAVDFLRWTFGDIADVSATTSTSVTERVDGDGAARRCTADDGFTATLTTTAGATMVVDSTFTAPVDRPSRLTVIGSEAVVELTATTIHEMDTRVALVSADGERDVVHVQLDEDSHAVHMRDWVDDVLEAVRRGEPGSEAPTFADGLAVTRVLDAMRR